MGFRVRIFHDGSVPPDPTLYIDPALLYDMAQAYKGGATPRNKKKKKKGRNVEDRKVQQQVAKEAAEKSEEYIQQSTEEVKANLGEANSEVIELAVRYAGMNLISKVLEDTDITEKSGGIMTVDGSRRRSKGGVFLQILQQRLTAEQHMLVFQKMPSPSLGNAGFGSSIPAEELGVAASAPTSIPPSGSMFDPDVQLSTSLGSSPKISLLSGSFDINAAAFVPRARRESEVQSQDVSEDGTADGMHSVSSSVDQHPDLEMMF